MLKYYLAQACQNTFILFDCLQLNELDESFLNESRLLLEQLGYDDVLILMQGCAKGSRFYAQMVVWGLDGSFGEFCGNGARACAAYLFDTYPLYEEFFLVTKQGEHPLRKYGGGIYSIQIPPPRYVHNPLFVKKMVCSDHHYVEMIEPHLVIAQQMSEDELYRLGRELNARRDCFPLGINVNAYHVLEEGAIQIKTYERGVQRLTKACGTGSMACAAWHKQNAGTLQVINPGGSVEVSLLDNGVLLKGEASFV